MEDKQILIVALLFGWAIVLGMGLISGKLFGAPNVIAGGIWLIICGIIFLWKINKEEN